MKNICCYIFLLNENPEKKVYLAWWTMTSSLLPCLLYRVVRRTSPETVLTIMIIIIIEYKKIYNINISQKKSASKLAGRVIIDLKWTNCLLNRFPGSYGYCLFAHIIGLRKVYLKKHCEKSVTVQNKFKLWIWVKSSHTNYWQWFPSGNKRKTGSPWPKKVNCK